MAPLLPLNKPVLYANLRLFKDLEEVSAVLEAARIPFLVLKGAVFAVSLYPRCDLRPMEDLDLLLPEDRETEARGLLEAEGFRSVPGGPSELRRGATVLDIGSAVWYLDARGRREVWKRAITLEGQGTRIPTLCWEDHFLYLVAHNAVHHAWWDEAHVRDLILLLERGLDWAAVARRARRYRLDAPLAASLRLLKIQAPQGLASSLSPLGNLEAEVYFRLLRGASDTGVGHLLRLWTAPNRLYALLRWLFPGRVFLRARYGADYPCLFGGLRPFLLFLSGLRSLVEFFSR